MSLYDIRTDEEEESLLEMLKGVGARTGSRLLDTIMQLDRPRRGVFLGAEAAVEGDDVLEEALKGLKLEEDLRTQDLFKTKKGKELIGKFTGDPEYAEKHGFQAGVAGFVGDVAFDPLTYVPFIGGWRFLGKLGMAVTPTIIKRMGAQFGETGLANALGIYGGRSKIAKQMLDKARDRMAKSKYDVRQEVTDLRVEIQKIADETGTEYKDVARALNESLESPLIKEARDIPGGTRPTTPGETPEMFPDSFDDLDVGKLTSREVLERELGMDSERAFQLSEKLKTQYKKMLDEEKMAGVDPGDIKDRADALGISDYVLHTLATAARQRAGSSSWKDWFRKKPAGKDPTRHPSMTERELEGTIKEINEAFMAKQRARGIKNPTPYFHEDAAMLMGIRRGRSDRALTGANYLKELAARFGRKEKFVGGEELPNIKALEGIYFDRDMARIISRHHKNLMDTTSQEAFLKQFDTVQGLWKMWSLGVRPAYHTRNIVGNIWNAYSLAGVKGPSGIKAYKDAGRLQNAAWRNDLPLDDVMMKTKVDGEVVELSSKDVWDMAIERGVLGRGQYSGDIVLDLERDLVRGGIGRVQGMAKNQRERYKALKKAESSVRELGAEIPLASRLGGSESLPLKWGFALGNMAEGNARMAVFIDALRKGKSADEAGWLVKKVLFDYSDLSSFERNVLKRVIPFYTWTRKNIPAQIEGILKNPERYQKITTIREQIEHKHGRPDPKFTEWWGKRVPIYLGKEDEGEIWNMVSLLNYAPVADLERLGSPLQLAAEMTTPILKAPIEYFANYSTYRGKQIQQYKGQTQDFLGIRMPKRLVNLAENLVPIAELNRLNPFGIFGEALLQESGKVARTPSIFGVSREQAGGYDLERGSRLLRYLTGLRSYPVNERKGRYWAQRNIEDDLKRLEMYLKRALRGGRSAEAEELISLIRSYKKGEVENPLLRRKV